MLLFKADDTQKHKSRVDKDGVRHTAPELDDTGDFLKEVYSPTNHAVFQAAFKNFNESTPRLLSAKFHVEDADDDEATFSIYDRGVHSNYREKGEDGGIHVRWKGYECWANNHEVPSNRWVHLKVTFDCR
ncbi:hypothetical protein GN244_ATG13488 [Phytophthora infestans]|uniref:Uncharacterized protein n=1 Tax=Phytophthora infestans TaxID=4787 RepID=A0A833VYS7_PHYIN|nr:hypothetical protein GN244_ATG13488 [Phytophthora infestans]